MGEVKPLFRNMNNNLKESIHDSIKEVFTSGDLNLNGFLSNARQSYEEDPFVLMQQARNDLHC